MLVDAIMNPNVVTVTRDHTILRATRVMRDENVGSVVIVDEENRPLGLLTDRDVAVKAIANGMSHDTPVDEVMSSPVHCVFENSLVFDVLRQMAEHHVHRIPVVDVNRQLLGIVSVDDALLLLTTELSNVAEVMARSSRALS